MEQSGNENTDRQREDKIRLGQDMQEEPHRTRTYMKRTSATNAHETPLNMGWNPCVKQANTCSTHFVPSESENGSR